MRWNHYILIILDWRSNVKLLREETYRYNTYSNPNSFFFLTILIFHHKSAQYHKNTERKEKQRIIRSFCFEKWVPSIPKSNQKRDVLVEVFQCRCSDWWQFVTVAKVTHGHTLIEAFPLWFTACWPEKSHCSLWMAPLTFGTHFL